MYDFDEGGLAMRAGSCHVALGDHRVAVAAFQDALTLVPAGHERRRAEIHLGPACAHLGLRDGEQALRNASEALTAFAARGSAAGTRLVHGFRGVLAARGQHAAASLLDDQARAVGPGTA
jgi:hypothetical protein